MIRRYFLATFILLFSLSSFASENSNAGLNCLKTSKFVLFSKAINTISLRYDDHITTQFDNGHYNSFEYTQLKTDKTSLLPKTLCSEDIKISIKEFTKSIKKNCLQQANIDEYYQAITRLRREREQTAQKYENILKEFRELTAE
jgi:hypothetical protein